MSGVHGNLALSFYVFVTVVLLCRFFSSCQLFFRVYAVLCWIFYCSLGMHSTGVVSRKYAWETLEPFITMFHIRRFFVILL